MKDSQDVFRSVIEYSPTATIITVPDGIILFANEAACKLFGYTEEELKRTAREVLFKENDQLQQALYKRMQNGVFRGELIATRKNGETFPCDITSVLFTDKTGDPIITNTFIDRTEQKATEQKIRSFQENLHLLLANTEESFLMVNRDLKLILFNETAAFRSMKLLGFKMRMGISILEMAEPSRHQILIKLYNDVFAGMIHQTEVKFPLPDGTFRYFVNYFRPARDKNGEIASVIVSARDVTATKLAEEKLKQSEQYYKSIIENSSDGFLIVSSNELVRDVSPSCQTILGDDCSKILERKLSDLVHPDDYNSVHDAFDSVIKDPSQVVTVDFRYRLFTGKNVWIESNLTNLLNEPAVRGIVLNFRDVTDKKLAEKRLKRSKAQYKMLFKSNPVPAWIFDLSTLEFIDVNDAALRQYGYSSDEFKKMTIKDLVPGDEIPSLLNDLQKISEPASPGRNVWRHKKKNGEIIYVEIRSNTLAYRGRTAGLVMAHDITVKVGTEAELLKSTERFLLATKATSDAIWDWDIKTNDLKWGEGLYSLFGYQPSETTYDKWKTLIHEDDRKKIKESLDKTLSDGESTFWREEYRLKKVDGTYRHVLDHGYIVRDASKHPLRMIGAIKDITILKEKEQQLTSINEQFYFASKATSDIIWDWNLIENTIQWSDNYTRIFGHILPPDSLIPLNSCIKNFHPEDSERVNKSLEAAILDPDIQNWESEFRYARADGSYAYVIDKGYIIRNMDGKGVRMIGAMHDISEQKYHQQILELELHVFETSVTPNISIRQVVHSLLEGIEQIHPGMLCSVSELKEDQRIYYLAAPSLPAQYLNIAGKWVPGPKNGSTGTAIFTKKTVIVADIDTDPLWKDYLPDIREFGLKASWSIPIIDSNGILMGTFDVYFKQVKQPTESLWNTILRVRNLLRILMQNHKAAEQMRISNERYDIVSKATHDLIWDWNLEIDELYREPRGVQKIFQPGDNNVMRHVKNWLQQIHPDDREKVQSAIHERLKMPDQNTFEIEYRFQNEEGTYSFVYDRGYIMRNAEGKAYRMIGAAQNITERKRLEQRLLEHQLTRQKFISQATIDTQERERGEIGKELHDNVNQVLTTTKLYLDLAITNHELKDELINKSSKNIIYVINEIRQLSRSLMLPSLGDLGLIDSINDLAENINATHKLQVIFVDYELDEDLLGENQKLVIYRITQEGLNNVLKHAKATTATIEMTVEEDIFRLIIKDDGTGFDLNKVKKGAGLNNIQNRVYLFNGSLTINTAPGNGCELIIEIPYNLNPIEI